MATKNSPEMAPGPIIDFCYPEIMVEKAKKEVCGGRDLFYTTNLPIKGFFPPKNFR